MGVSRKLTVVDIEALWDFNDLEGTRNRIYDAIASTECNYSIGQELFTQLARIDSLRGKYEKAHRSLERVRECMGSIYVSDRVRMRYYLELGRTYNSGGRSRDALRQFLNAWQIGRAERSAPETGMEALTIDAAHMIAIVYSDRGLSSPKNVQKAFEWNLRALELARGAAEPRAKRWEGSLLNNLGCDYRQNGDLERALESFQAAVPIFEARGEQGPLWIAHWQVANTLRLLGRREEALEIFLRLEREQADAGKPSPFVASELALLGQTKNS